MKREQGIKTLCRNLQSLLKRMQDNDFSSPSEDKAVQQAIAILKTHPGLRDLWIIAAHD